MYLSINASYNNPILANQTNRKLGIFDRKLEGSHSIYIAIYRQVTEQCDDISSIFQLVTEIEYLKLVHDLGRP